MELLHVYIPLDMNFFNESNIISTAFYYNNENNKSKKYFSADQESTQIAFKNLKTCFLTLKDQEYSGETCVISLQTQKEILQEICKEAEWDKFLALNVRQKFKAFPVIGRTVCLEPMKRNDSTDGITWKFFFLQTRSLPKVHSIANSQDLAPLMGYRDERWNCILPTYRFDKSLMTDTEIKSIKQVMNHLVSSLIMDSSEFFIPDIILIVSASVLEYLLNQSIIDAFMQKDLELVQYLVEFYGSKKWRKYQDLSTDVDLENPNEGEWRKGLITEIGIDGLKCEHVKKFVLAWFIRLRKEETAMAGKVLKTLMIQSVVEASGRLFAATRCTVKPLCLKRMGLSDFHRKVVGSKFNYVHLAYDSYDSKEFCENIKMKTMSILDGLSDSYIYTLHGVEKATTDKRVTDKVSNLMRTFENLARIAKIDPGEITLTELELCACLHLGFKWKTSWERNQVVHGESVIGVSEADLFKMAMEGGVRDRFVRDVVNFIPREWGSFYEVMNEGFHDMLPFPVPRSYCERLLSETGVDFEKSAKIDPKTRLPRRACAHPRCKFFMKVVKSRRKLQMHLKCVDLVTIPGFHKVVSDPKYVGDVEGAVEAIKAGAALVMPKEGELHLDDLKESIWSAVEAGSQMWCMDVPEEYLLKVVGDAIDSYGHGSGRGDEMSMCSYETFKAAVIGAK